MSKRLGRFRPGRKVCLSCHHRGCESVGAEAILGREVTKEIHPNFLSACATGRVGRIRWDQKHAMRAFQLETDVPCHNCRALFRDALIFSRGRNRRPLIFGYEPEPA